MFTVFLKSPLVAVLQGKPYSINDELCLTVEQIIPTQDVEEYMRGMTENALGNINLQTETK
jgi:hypothetical protein